MREQGRWCWGHGDSLYSLTLKLFHIKFVLKRV